MAIMQQLLLAMSGGLVQQVQQVSITIAANTTSGTATISAVNTSYSSEHYSGSNAAHTSYNPATDNAGVQLTDSTTLTATRNTLDASNALVVYATVISWNPAKITSIQRGTITMTAASSNTAALTFTLANAVVQYNGSTTTYTGNNPNHYMCQVVLTSGTVTASRGGISNNATAYYCLIEFASGVLNSNTRQGTTSFTSATSGTASISAVTLAQTMLIYGGAKYTGGAATADSVNQYLQLTNSTTVTGTTANSNAGTQTAPFGVLEFKSADINSVNRGAIVIATSAATNTATITAVTTTKTIPNYLGYAVAGGSTNNPAVKNVTLALTNSTTLTLTRNTATASFNDTGGYEAVEFK